MTVRELRDRLKRVPGDWDDLPIVYGHSEGWTSEHFEEIDIIQQRVIYSNGASCMFKFNSDDLYTIETEVVVLV